MATQDRNGDATARGRLHAPEPAPPDALEVGIRGNARLTALTGLVLLVALLIEGVTILRIGPWVVPHVVVGFALISPVLLKMGTTGYKIVRYYTGDPVYVAEGPPPIVRRLLGPVVIVSTLAVLGTGVALGLVGPNRVGPWLSLHKASFVLWFVVMTVHVLAHLVRTASAAVAEYGAGAAAPDGRPTRQLVLVASIVLAVALGGWGVQYAHPWANATQSGHQEHR